MNKKFSIVIPVFNEEKNINKLEKKIFNCLKNIQYEIIFVDDESTDGTLKILEQISKKKILVFLFEKIVLKIYRNHVF